MSEGLKVLSVEDDKDIRILIEFALEDECFELTSCDSGQEALTKLVELTPDVILLDVMMPGIDGPATLKKIRELPNLITTPVIFMTAKIQTNEIEEYKALGAVGVINKPFDPMALANDIHNLLDRCND